LEFAALTKRKGRKFKAHIAYSESKDGINWKRPHLTRFPPPGGNRTRL
jgi:hypothetical protein